MSLPCVLGEKDNDVLQKKDELVLHEMVGRISIQVLFPGRFDVFPQCSDILVIVHVSIRCLYLLFICFVYHHHTVIIPLPCINNIQSNHKESIQ